jgi:hypothetical protein
VNRLAELRSRNGCTTFLGYDLNASFDELVRQGYVDCYIVSSEDGFSPLGAARSFFSSELGIAEGKIRELADWNRFSNANISLIGLSNQNPSSTLRGIVLAAGESSQCYKQFNTVDFGQPYRDFYYNVAYESIAYAANVLGARKLAMSHLSSSGRFHEDIATCVAEALAHFCDDAETSKIDSFVFVGCCIQQAHLYGIQRLNAQGNVSRHREIQKVRSTRDGFPVINIDWR